MEMDIYSRLDWVSRRDYWNSAVSSYWETTSFRSFLSFRGSV